MFSPLAKNVTTAKSKYQRNLEKFEKFQGKMSNGEPTSPASDSGSSSSRSDWFRQSVLFWSSQSERSVDRDSPNENRDTPVEETDDEDVHGSPSDSESEETFGKNPRKNILDEFDPTDLLKQVEELERCFKKTRPESLIEEEYQGTINSGTGSPHLTLEFPTGSSIRENPLFKKDLLLRKKVDGTTCTDREESVNCEGDRGVTNSERKDDFRLDLDFQEDDQKNMESSTPVTEDQEIIESIQKVQNTLCEISREIERSSSSRLTECTTSDRYEESDIDTPRNETESDLNDESVSDNRDPNDVMRDWLSNIKPPPSPVVETECLVSETMDLNAAMENNSAMKSQEENPKNDIEIPKIPDIVSPRNSTTPSHNELFQKIDELINFDRPDSENTLGSHRSSSAKSSNRDRLDSGLQSVSSDSGSPYPSPNITRAPLKQPPKSNAIREVAREVNDHVFRDDSDFSEWSPVSTLESNRGSRMSISSRPKRSQSISYSPRNPKQIHYSNSDDTNVNAGGLETSGEVATIEKFLKLTNQYLDSDGVSSISSNISLDDLAMLPNLRESLEQQRKELEEQRKKQEDFLHQLGDLLLEVVTLKEEQSTVRSKQTKALNLLKKQLDAHKKSQSKAHTDVINKVKSLDEKLSTSLNLSSGEHQTQISPISPGLGSKGFVYPVSGLNDFRQQEENSQRGHIIWKVSDVMKKLTRVKTGSSEGTVVSPSFQTGEYGYRMNGWLYLNGRGKMTGKYLSLYVCVLVGDYDAILKWPIKPSYTLTLMDQNGDSHKRHDHVKVRRVLDIAGRGANVISQYGGIPRPSDCTKALIVGFDDFISHEKLLERRYLADDTLFIKIEANIS
uniref:MATH domain-containing protein n=1 Tax=Clytia hemisphaerica TaxID=252671 RepID=A0A7M5X701_9CNID